MSGVQWGLLGKVGDAKRGWLKSTICWAGEGGVFE